MIYSVNKNSSAIITRVALNSGGGVLDLTSATITITGRQFGNSSVTLFSKVSTDIDEIEKVNSTRGNFIVKLTASDTASLNLKSILLNLP
jgi:hypothetical protein